VRSLRRLAVQQLPRRWGGLSLGRGGRTTPVSLSRDQEAAGFAAYLAASAEKERGNLPSALKLFERSAALDHRAQDAARYGLASLLFDLEDYERADPIVDELLKATEDKTIREAASWIRDRIRTIREAHRTRETPMAQQTAPAPLNAHQPPAPSTHTSTPLDAGDRREAEIQKAIDECHRRRRENKSVFHERYWIRRAKAIELTGRVDALPEDLPPTWRNWPS
jgi:tetratricopeptide (TPR) repeat protein